MDPNPVWPASSWKGEIWTQRHAKRKDDVKRQREKPCKGTGLEWRIYKPGDARDCWKPPAMEQHEHMLPTALRSHQPANTLRSAFWTPELRWQMCYLKPPRLWHFVKAALGNKYSISTVVTVSAKHHQWVLKVAGESLMRNTIPIELQSIPPWDTYELQRVK